ncbi:hypothetical protein ACOMHN_047958 [Nucella lapillus]
MGKNKRKMPEDPAVNDPCPEEAAHQADEDTATSSKHKKCKKSKKEDRQHSLEPSEHAEQMSDKKKKKKRKAEEEDLEDSVLEDARPPKQKMRKMKEVDILKNEGVATKMCYTLECSLEGIQVVKKRKKDKKKKSLQSGKKADSMTKSHDRAVNGSQLKGFCAKTGTECDENGQEAREKDEKKKTKHKKKKTGLEAEEIQNGSAEMCKANGTDSSKKTGDTVQSHEVKKDKKKHKKDKSEPDSKENHNGTADEFQANTTDSSERKKRKKPKKVKAMEDTKDTESKDTTKGKDKKKKDKKMQPGQNVTPEDIVEEVKQKKKDKKKKEKIQKTLILTETTTNGENGSEIMKEEKRSKKKKRAENTDESTCNTEVAGSDVKGCGDETKPKKKKKKKSKDEEQQGGAGDSDSKICRENSELNHQNQKEDAANNPGDTQTDSRQTNNNSAQPARVGQWGTNMFKDNQRQNKFLRLLGGLKKSGDGSQPAPGPKKGLYGSLQPKEDSSSVGGQRALTYQAAAAMNRRLESDFDRALTFSARGQRGVGLGFQPDPAEGKKMHIDVNRVRSKKLD